MTLLVGASSSESWWKVKPLLLVSLITLWAVTSVASDIESVAADLWHGTDAQRIEFVTWVNAAQPCRGLSMTDILAIFGDPDDEYENKEDIHNGVNEVVTAFESTDVERPKKWLYRTLRPGTPESQEQSGEGSGYLFDLEIHFGVGGLVYGCGSTQFVTSGDYYALLEEASSSTK